MAHSCHATGCTKSVPPEMFMCRGHWFALPRPLRNRIWATYRPGQCDDWRPSREYLLAAKEAVTWLANKEGREPDTSIYDTFLAAPEFVAVVKETLDGMTAPEPRP